MCPPPAAQMLSTGWNNSCQVLFRNVTKRALCVGNQAMPVSRWLVSQAEQLYNLLKWNPFFLPNRLSYCITVQWTMQWTPFYTMIKAVEKWEMEKAYKIALSKLCALKINTQNMCKKCSKSCKNEQKFQKLHKKGNKKLKTARETFFSTAVKN